MPIASIRRVIFDPSAVAHGAIRDHRHFRYYDLYVHAFVVILLVSNIVAPKLVEVGPYALGFFTLGPFLLSGAQILFPLTYIFGDIFTEVYGYAASRRAIWIGFFASLLLAVVSTLIVAMPSAPSWTGQAAYEYVLGFLPRIVIASLIAYLAGEFANAIILSRMKVMTNGRHLWMRTIGSTVVGQAVDTMLVIAIVFGGTQPLPVLLNLMMSGYIAKVLFEVAATPLTYAVVNFCKRSEGIDVYDVNADYNPFHSMPPPDLNELGERTGD
ncbi:MAG: queuosine precursor transporter [Bryobacterales bacterium]|nr:queuosine precursor transporter [Bryobacterales bacterium]